jgi:type II secretory ATPase GspE/PulE/Tfp pilus assembly ATPase PilB-like protein
MQQDAVQKVLDGFTSLEECMRVIYVEGAES